MVVLSQEARADLQRLARLLRDGQDRLWFKFGQHFVDGAPAIVFATDASGLAHKGFGGYVVPGPRTLEQEHHKAGGPTQTLHYSELSV